MKILATTKTLYERLLDAGLSKEDGTLDSHESDLYVKSTPESDAIVRGWLDENGYSEGHSAKKFRDEIDHEPWWDVAFAYDPYWAKRGMM